MGADSREVETNSFQLPRERPLWKTKSASSLFNHPDPLLGATARAVISAIAASFIGVATASRSDTRLRGGASWMAEH